MVIVMIALAYLQVGIAKTIKKERPSQDRNKRDALLVELVELVDPSNRVVE
jgi:hypothetical protein